MQTHCTRSGVGGVFARSVLAAVLAGTLMQQPLVASDAWSRVEKLKPGTMVYVQLPGERYLDGAFILADSSSMSIRTEDRKRVALERDLVLRVSVDGKKRHWYTIPLAAVAGAVGGFAGYKIADNTTCSGVSPDDCRKGKSIIVLFSALVPSGAAYYFSRGQSGRKIIYTKKR